MEIKFRSDVVAIPSLGGIIVGLPLFAEEKSRFPAAVCLKVSQAVTNSIDFVIVELDGVGVALHPTEANRLGLTEAPCWVPDLTGVSAIPFPGEIERHLSTAKARL